MYYSRENSHRDGGGDRHRFGKGRVPNGNRFENNSPPSHQHEESYHFNGNGKRCKSTDAISDRNMQLHSNEMQLSSRKDRPRYDRPQQKQPPHKRPRYDHHMPQQASWNAQPQPPHNRP
eukprot:scaffold14910_cov172-Skeletonema_dohrnii-CCMP3373.AAC.1